MDTAPPPAPPYGSLIERARKGIRLSIRAAAAHAGISKATWIDNVRGHRKRGGVWERIDPKPETIARMAHAAHITPKRLAGEGPGEGQRPDAAEILEEILRNPPAPPPVRAVPEPPPADPADPGDPDVQILEDLLARHPDDEVVQWLGTIERKEPWVRVNEIRDWLQRKRAQESGTDG
jgi:transcriptional regulator with XRE-family HTH domain